MANRPVFSFKRRHNKRKQKRSARIRKLRRPGISNHELNTANWTRVIDPNSSIRVDDGETRKIMKGGNARDCKIIAPGICSKIFDVGNGQAEMVIKIEGKPNTLFDVQSHRVNNLETALKSYVETYSTDKNGITLQIPNAGQVMGKIMSSISQLSSGVNPTDPREEVDLS